MKQLLLAVLLIPMLCIGQFKPPAPFPQTDIHDYDNVLSQPQKDALNAKILAFRHSSSIEIAVVVLSDLQGREIEDVATTLFRSWGIGKKELDNGVLYIVSPNNRTAKIEVGNGLEGDLPDVTTKKIQVPARDFYRQQNYYAGIDTVLNGIISTLKPISWQQREDLKKAKEKEEELAAQKVINFFKWLAVFIITLGSAIALMWYSARQKRKEKEEAERKERERVREEQDKQMRLKDAEQKERRRKSLLHDIKQLLSTVNNIIAKHLDLEARNRKDYERYGVDIKKLSYNINVAIENLKAFVETTVKTLTETTPLNHAERIYSTLSERIDTLKLCIHSADKVMQANIQRESYVNNFLKTAAGLRAKALQYPHKDIRDDLFNKFGVTPASQMYLLYDTAVQLNMHYDNIINAKLYEQQRLERERKRKLEEEEEERKRKRRKEEEEEDDRRRRNSSSSYGSSSSSFYSSGSSSSSSSSYSDSGSYGGGSSSGGGSTDSW